MSVINQSNIERGAMYKQVLNDMRSGKKAEPKSCPLNSKNIGIISENDHLNRKCLCPICTCGKHVCPSLAIPDPYPVSTFNSSYMSNYKPRTPLKTMVPQNRGNFLPSVSFDFETTNSDAYKPHSVQVSASNFRNHTSSPPKTPFHSHSSYASNFLDWGGRVSQVVKPGHQLHTTEEVKLKGKSSYQVNYGNLNEEELKMAKQGKVNIGKKTHIDPKAQFAKVTTSRKEFIDYSKNYIKAEGFKPDNNLGRMKSVDNHFVTTNKKDYASVLGEPDSRYLRKIIEKEGLT